MKLIRELLIVGTGGFIGAIARYLVSGWVQKALDNPFPFGTLAVNSAGAFILGLLTGIMQNNIVSPEIRMLVGIGILGAFTTFSTFSYETLMLLRSGSVFEGILNVVVSLVLGLLFVYAGFVAGQAI